MNQATWDWLKNNPEYKSVRLVVCDLNGILRGKRFPLDSIEKLIKNGSRMPLSTSCIDIWGNDLYDSPFLFAEVPLGIPITTM